MSASTITVPPPAWTPMFASGCSAHIRSTSFGSALARLVNLTSGGDTVRGQLAPELFDRDQPLAATAHPAEISGDVIAEVVLGDTERPRCFSRRQGQARRVVVDCQRGSPPSVTLG